MYTRMMSNFICKLGVVVAIVGMFAKATVTTVKAQAMVDQDQTAASQSLESASIASQLTDLEQQYRGQLQEYRTAERTAQIAKTQLEQLDTLTALEDAVQATKASYVLRDQVLLTYVKQLRLRLIASLGIPLELKNTGIKRLEEDQTFLEKHLELSQQATTKEDITALADTFAILALELKADAFHNTSLLAFGKVQSAYDKSQALVAYTEQQIKHQKLSEVTRAQLTRNLAVIKELSTTTQQELQQVANTLATTKSNELDVSYYNQVAAKLSSPYSSISRMISFVEETARVRE